MNITTVSNTNGHGASPPSSPQPNEQLENLSRTLERLYRLTIQIRTDSALLQQTPVIKEQWQFLWEGAVQTHVKLSFNIQEKLDQFVLSKTARVFHNPIGFNAFLQSLYYNCNLSIEEQELRLNFLNQCVQSASENTLEISPLPSVESQPSSPPQYSLGRLEYLNWLLERLCIMAQEEKTPERQEFWETLTSKILEAYKALSSDKKEKLNQFGLLITPPIYEWIEWIMAIKDNPFSIEQVSPFKFLCECVLSEISPISESEGTYPLGSPEYLHGLLGHLCTMTQEEDISKNREFWMTLVSKAVKAYEALPSDTKEKLNQIVLPITLPIYQWSVGFITILKILYNPSIHPTDRVNQLQFLCQCVEKVFSNTSIQEASAPKRKTETELEDTRPTQRLKQSHENPTDSQQQPPLVRPPLKLPSLPQPQLIQQPHLNLTQQPYIDFEQEPLFGLQPLPQPHLQQPHLNLTQQPYIDFEQEPLEEPLFGLQPLLQPHLQQPHLIQQQPHLQWPYTDFEQEPPFEWPNIDLPKS